MKGLLEFGLCLVLCLSKVGFAFGAQPTQVGTVPIRVGLEASAKPFEFFRTATVEILLPAMHGFALGYGAGVGIDSLSFGVLGEWYLNRPIFSSGFVGGFDLRYRLSFHYSGPPGDRDQVFGSVITTQLNALYAWVWDNGINLLAGTGLAYDHETAHVVSKGYKTRDYYLYNNQIRIPIFLKVGFFF